MTYSGVFAALCSLSPITSLNDFRTLLVQKLVTAIGTEQLNFLVSEFVPVTIELAFALWAGHPKNFRHGAFPPDCAKKQSLGFDPSTQVRTG
jgi:hypothetical protein